MLAQNEPTTTPTLSDRKLAANRANAQKSTGPRTEAGKARSSRNAFTHGLTAQSPTLLPGENEATYTTFLQSVFAEYNPQTPTQHLLVQRIADLHWRLQRLASAESHLFVLHHEQQIKATDARNLKAQHDYKNLPFRDRSQTPPPTPEPQPQLDPGQILAQYFLQADDKSNPFTRLQRYEASLQRALEKTLHQLRTLKKDYESNPPSEDPDQPDESPAPPSSPPEARPQNEPTADSPPLPAVLPTDHPIPESRNPEPASYADVPPLHADFFGKSPPPPTGSTNCDPTSNVPSVL